MNKFATFMRESNVARFFIPLGLILIVAGIIILVISIKNQNYIEIEAVVTNVYVRQEEVNDDDGIHMEDVYDVSFKYIVDGKEYNNKFDGISKYNVGDKMTIYYNPNNPQEITGSKSIIIPVVMIIGGIASTIGGTISAVNAVKKHNKMKEQERSWNNE